MVVTTRELQGARARLESERVRLQEVRTSLVDDASLEQPERLATAELSLADQHPADYGTEMFEREKDLSILEQVDAELHGVEQALRRVEEGSYGTCEACGGPIGAERLRARPAAHLCVDDQARLERMNGHGR